MPASKSSQKKNDTTTWTTTEPTETKKTTKATKELKVESTTTKKEPVTKAKKETKKVEHVTIDVAPTTETPEVQNVVVASDVVETSITENFSEFIVKFQGMMSQFSSLKNELRTLERKTVKQLKVVQKLNNKKKRKGTRAPSGFVKPAPISNELAQFLGKPEGSEMARTDVTREINKYIRAHNLQDKENGRKINPDQSLTTLLKLTDDIVLTYFNLQRYMGPHFPKQPKPGDVGYVAPAVPAS
tara:strand:- start:28 stop:756 length:729 start_codon:yes stop_codon:yes gene_type:complete